MDTKHIFILNPAAGKKGKIADFEREICRICQQRGIDFTIKITNGIGNATEIVKEESEKNADKICRFYACGGDGTLNEVVSGAVLCDNAQVACYPCGTGNDFVKVFDGVRHFKSFEDLIDGEATPIDVMRIGSKYSVNLLNTGLDARVAQWAGKNKRKCVFGGSFPYKVAILNTIMKKLTRTYRIIADGRDLSGEYTIMVVASGRYYGGGFYAVPDAQPDDGMLDLLFVKKLSRLKIASVIGKYEKGRYRELSDLVFRTRCKSVHFVSENEEPISLDGEIHNMKEFTVEVVPHKLRFIVPKGAKLTFTEYVESHNLEEKEEIYSK